MVDADGLKYLPEKLPEHLAAHPACRGAGQAAGEDRSWVTDGPGTRRPSSGRAHRSDGAVSKARPSWWPSPDTDAVCRSRVPGPAWTGSGRLRRRTGGLCATVLAAGFAAALAAALSGRLAAGA